MEKTILVTLYKVIPRTKDSRYLFLGIVMDIHRVIIEISYCVLSELSLHNGPHWIHSI